MERFRHDLDDGLAALHRRVRDAGNAIDLRDRFRLYPDYTRWLIRGEKSSTVRYVESAVDLPTARRLPLHVSYRDRAETVPVGPVEISAVTVTAFGDLTRADAERDGFEERAELVEGLQRIYGDIPADHPVTIYHVAPVDARKMGTRFLADARR